MAKFETFEYRRGDMRDICNMTGCSHTTIVKILHGKRNCETRSGILILKALSMLKEVRSRKITLDINVSK